MSKSDCKARQHSDQMVCHACGLVWDMNDPDPPTCGNQPALFPNEQGSAPQIMPGKLPQSLPVELAAEMDRAYRANSSEGLTGRLRGMQAAYRVLLDRMEA